jgi:hypothetical protein
MPRRVVDCMLVGGLSTTFRVLLCGRWCLRAFCGVYKRKGTMFWGLQEDFGEDKSLFSLTS